MTETSAQKTGVTLTPAWAGHAAPPVTGPPTYYWAAAVSGGFHTPAYWRGGVAPGYGANVVLPADGGSPFTVTVGAYSSGASVNSIQIAANATLALSGPNQTHFFAANGGANAGVISIAQSAILGMGGTLVNSGVISLSASRPQGDILEIVSGAALTLSGGGKVILSDSNYNFIVGASSPQTLTNIDNTLSGSGSVSGNSQLSFVNGAEGVIDATGNRFDLFFADVPTFSNAGLVEATGERGLLINTTTIDNTATGIISVGTDSIVQLYGARIVGGTLTSTGTGTIEAAGADLLDGVTATLTNQAAISVYDNGVLTIQGAIANSGKIVLAGKTHVTELLVGSVGVTLSGHGTVSLGDNTFDVLDGAGSGATLTNVDNKILGGGLLGNGQLTLLNEAKGVIDGNAAVALAIDTGSNIIVNAGTIEATGVGTVTVAGAVTNTGAILANHGNVTIAGNIDGKGREIVSGPATLEIASSFGGGAKQAVSFAAGSTGVFEIDHTQVFGGTLKGLATGRTLDLADISFASASFTYSGSATRGVLTVGDGMHFAHITLLGAYTQANFALAADSGGHTDVTYNGTGMAAVHPLVAAMAVLGAHNAATVHTTPHDFHAAPTLLAPRTQIA